MLRAVLGDLLQTTDGNGSPDHLVAARTGHPLGANQVLVGHQACLGHGGGHTTWTCRTCDQTVYGPPMNTHCTALEGPAAVRISTRRDEIPNVGRAPNPALVAGGPIYANSPDRVHFTRIHTGGER